MNTTSLPRDYSTAFAPLANWQKGHQHGHTVQFYAEDTFLLDSLAGLVETALVEGRASIVVCTQPHRKGLTRRLKSRQFDTSTAAKQGRYLVLDASETLASFMANDLPDAARFAECIGSIITRAKAATRKRSGQVLVFGEMVSLLWLEGRRKAALRLEQLWNELARSHAFSLHCAYPINAFHHADDGALFQDICGAHSEVIPSESYTSLNSEGDRLRSITHLQQKAQALETESAERKQTQQVLKRRKSELAELLENAVEGAQQLGPTGDVLWANRALLNLLGYPAAEYINHSLGDFCKDRNSFEKFWRRLMQREEIYDCPLELQCKDGSVKHLLVNSNGLWRAGSSSTPAASCAM